MINQKLLKTNLKNRNILLTGALGNLGKNIIEYLNYLEANVYACDVKGNVSLSGLNKKCSYFKLDVTKKKQWINLKSKLKKKNIFIDTLINCAGYTNHSNKKKFMNDVFKIEPEHLKNIFDVNTFGLIYGCIVFGEDMVKNKKGNIVNISSMYGLKSPKHHIYKGTNIKSPLAYAASKSSVISITKYLGTLWGKNGVRVNCISPGGIRDKTHKKKWLDRYGANNPIGRMADNFEMMNAIIYLISEGSSYSNASNVVVDGGWTAW